MPLHSATEHYIMELQTQKDRHTIMEAEHEGLWQSHDSIPWWDLKATVSLPKESSWQKETSQRETLVMKKKKEKVLRKGSCFTFTSLDPGVLHSRCFITCTASKVNRIEEPEQYKSLGFTQPSMQLSRSLFESSSALHPANLIYLSASLSLEFSWDISDKKSHTQLHTKEVSSP